MFLAKAWCAFIGVAEAVLKIKRSTRRGLSSSLLIIGAAVMFLATEAWSGILLVALGMSIELIAVILKIWKG